jgi:hypothetical protein
MSRQEKPREVSGTRGGLPVRSTIKEKMAAVSLVTADTTKNE